MSKPPQRVTVISRLLRAPKRLKQTLPKKAKQAVFKLLKATATPNRNLFPKAKAQQRLNSLDFNNKRNGYEILDFIAVFLLCGYITYDKYIFFDLSLRCQTTFQTLLHRTDLQNPLYKCSAICRRPEQSETAARCIL